MAYDFGQTQFGGEEYSLDDILYSQNMNSLLQNLGLPLDEPSLTEGFYTIDPLTLQALAPGAQQYRDMVTGTTQKYHPALMKAALELGSGRSGGIKRGERSFGMKQQNIMQPYLGALEGTYKDISSQISGARTAASSYLADILRARRDLDYTTPEGTPSPAGDEGGLPTGSTTVDTSTTDYMTGGINTGGEGWNTPPFNPETGSWGGNSEGSSFTGGTPDLPQDEIQQLIMSGNLVDLGDGKWRYISTSGGGGYNTEVDLGGGTTTTTCQCHSPWDDDYCTDGSCDEGGDPWGWDFDG